MDITYDDAQNTCCYKVPHNIYGNLNITHSERSALTVFWNVYQIFVYDDLIFENPRVFIPEFNIANLIVCNNYLICLDDNGNVHLTPIKLKHSVQKRLKSSFQPREQGVKCIENLHENTICIKYTSSSFYLCVHKVTTDFMLDIEHKIIFDDLSLSSLDAKSWIFHIYSTTSLEYDQIKDYYKQKDIWRDHVIIIFSLDRKNIYSILYSSKTGSESLIPIKLYTCPSEITDAFVIKFNNIHVIICMAIGTVIKISLNHEKNDMKVIHLNAAVSKIIPLEDCIIYTDGNTMWKSEDTFSESIRFKKCSIAQVKDFIIVRGKMICTTFSNIIYLVVINDELFQKLPQDKYCPAREVLSNDDCLARIMREVSKSNEIVRKIKDEEKNLTILSLSNRYDILDNVINYKVAVFETFDDVPKEDLTLVEKIQDYYCKDTFCFVITFNFRSVLNKFTELLLRMFGNLILHVAISSHTSSIKVLSIYVEGQLKKVNLAIPVFIKKTDFNRISVEIKLITSINDVFTSTKNMWTVLHSMRYNLNSEHFIVTKVPTDQIYCRAHQELGDLIYRSTVHHFGHLYKFTMSTRKTNEWLLYAKLVGNFQEFVKGPYLHTQFSTRKADILLKQLTSDEFIKSKHGVTFEIGKDRVILEIINDGFTEPMLKVRCTNVEKAHHIRNFFSEMVNNNFTDFEPGKVFVDHGLYSAIEKFERIIQESVNNLIATEFMEIFEKYQKGVIGKLPI